MTTNQLIEKKVQCPYCWESFTLLIDASVESQEYVEDCEICCHPIDFIVQLMSRINPGYKSDKWMNDALATN